MCSSPSAPAQKQEQKKPENNTTSNTNNMISNNQNTNNQNNTSTSNNANKEADAVLGSSAAGYKQSQTGLAGRDTRTTARGLADTARSKKKTLLGE